MPPVELSPTVMGERLRLARGAAGFTQAEAAARINAARTTLIAIEQGQRRIRTKELQQLAKLYGTTANTLLRNEAVYIDLVPQFRRFMKSSDRELQNAIRSLSNLVRAEVELEGILGIEYVRNYPPERPLLSGDVCIQAENDATELRQWLGLGSAPIADLRTILEMELGIRVYVRPLDSRISGLFAFEEAVGACMLLNANHSRGRRNQSGAHELGHFVSSRRTPEILHTHESDNSRAERYANVFGRAFLTPARAVMHKFHAITAGSSRLSRRHVILLAHTFGASREAMVRRLEELDLISQDSWDWFVTHGGITDEQARQVLGAQCTADADRQEASHPTSMRLGLLAAQAWLQDLLTEEQLAHLLNLDRVSLRQIVDSLGDDGDEVDAAPRLLH